MYRTAKVSIQPIYYDTIQSPRLSNPMKHIHFVTQYNVVVDKYKNVQCLGQCLEQSESTTLHHACKQYI